MSRQFEREFLFRAGVERVWEALTTPAEMEKWIGSKVLAFEPHPGGKIHLEGLHEGEIVEFEPPHRFTWAWDPDNGTEPVVETLTLEAVDGGTRIHLRSVLTGRWGEDPYFRGGIIAGWLQWMEGLANWLERGQVAASEPFGLMEAGLMAEESGAVERLLVKSVKAGGAAEAAGLQVGDILTTWDGQSLDQVATFWRLLWNSQAGQRIRLGVDRASEAAEVELVLAARP